MNKPLNSDNIEKIKAMYAQQYDPAAVKIIQMLTHQLVQNNIDMVQAVKIFLSALTSATIGIRAENDMIKIRNGDTASKPTPEEIAMFDAIKERYSQDPVIINSVIAVIEEVCKNFRNSQYGTVLVSGNDLLTPKSFV